MENILAVICIVMPNDLFLGKDTYTEENKAII